MSEETYRALVAALRAEFTPGGLAAMNIKLRAMRHVRGSMETLVEAIRDAGDPAFATEPPHLVQGNPELLFGPPWGEWRGIPGTGLELMVLPTDGLGTFRIRGAQ